MGIVLQDEKVLDLLFNDVNIFNNTGLCTFKWSTVLYECHLNEKSEKKEY